MFGTNTNNKGKIEKNAKVKEGPCIFPFKYKRETHNKCNDFTGKGEICATSVSKYGTLQTYGYCKPMTPVLAKQKTKKLKKTLKKPRKLKKKLILVEKHPQQQEKITEKKVLPKTTSKKSSLKTIPSNKVIMAKRYNEDFIKVLGQLYSIMMSKGEAFRARAYKKAQEVIMSVPENITDPLQLKGKKGIGETILKKLQEYVETGTLKVLEREKNNPIYIFTQVYGIGPKKAKELVEKHKITSIQLLRSNKQLLNDKQVIGLKYYEDVLKRIPRSEIDEYKVELQKVFDSIKTPGSTMEIVGSYRRGAADSGDIDIIIGNEAGNIAVFNSFLDKLSEKKMIIEFLSRGKIKSLVMAQLPGKTPRRVDFLFSPPDEYAFAVLYFTGSAIFNTVMRQRALDMGYSMNEHGMYKMVSGKKGAKLDMIFNTEKDIFNFLQMEYKTPVERKDGNAVVILEKVPSPVQEKTLGLIDDVEDEIKVKKTPMKEKITSIKEQKPPKKIKKIKKKLVLKDTTKTLKKPKTKKVSSKQHAKLFVTNGIDYLYDKDEATLVKILKDSNDAYYNKKPFLTDNQYDIIKEYVESRFPQNKILKEIGAPIEKQKVKLPYFMGSMDKIKPDTKALYKWMTKYTGPYVLSTKLDGISGLYYTEGGVRKLFTRGNGIHGQDISHLIPYLKLPDMDGLTIRGEIIMSKKVFEEKYAGEWSNARNMVSGIVNSKTRDTEKYNDLSFLAYEVIVPHKKPSEQYAVLDTLNIDVALNETTDTLTNEKLSETLVAWRESYPFEIDGVIAANDKKYARKDGNPDHAFAFKMVLSDQVVEAKVVDVLWTPSKDGYLKPRIRIEPVVIGGARIEYATAFNGAFVEENKIGIGAVIQMVRSGDVIPHIMDVVTPSTEAKMPDVEYKWNDTHVDIMLVDKSTNEIVMRKNITGFFVGLGVEGLAAGNIKKIMKSGKNSVEDILSMTIADFLMVEGFKQKMAEKVHNSIKQKIEEVSLAKLMSVSNLFGRGMGERRIDSVLAVYPDILTSDETLDAKAAKVLTISGFAKKTAQAFVTHIPDFMEFITKANLKHKLAPVKKVELDVSHPLFGKSILMTGFRDKELERKIKEIGGKMASSVSKNTFVVLVKDVEEDTGKAMKAKELGIPLMTPENFIKKYIS